MTELYFKVATKASFNLGEFNLKSFFDLKDTLRDQYVLQSYWLDQQMVGLDAPKTKVGTEAEEEAVLDDALPDLRARLNAL